jgi:nucleolar protein 58
VVKLKAFSKFENTTEALQAAASLVDSKLSKGERACWQKLEGRQEGTAVAGSACWFCT